MDFTWLLVVMALAVFVSLVVLAVVCLRCRNERPLGGPTSVRHPVSLPADGFTSLFFGLMILSFLFFPSVSIRQTNGSEE